MVITEVIQCISSTMNEEHDQTLVLKLLKILNKHHSQLIQRTVTRAELFNCTSESISTTTEEIDKENIELEQDHSLKFLKKEQEISKAKRRSSIEKNSNNMLAYQSNLDKVNEILS